MYIGQQKIKNNSKVLAVILGLLFLLVASYITYISKVYAVSFLENWQGYEQNTSPSNPSFVTNLMDPDDSTRLEALLDVFVVGNYAYVTSYVDNALVIIDISDPQNPSIAGSIVDNFYLARPRGLFVENNLAYIAVENNYAFTIVDVQNPASLLIRDSIEWQDPSLPSDDYLNGPRSVFVEGGYAYLTAYGGDALTIFNINDPDNIVFEGGYSDSGYLNYVEDVFVVGDVAYVVSGANIGSFITFDVTDRTNPQPFPLPGGLISNQSSWLNRPKSVVVSGDYAYVASEGSSSLAVIDVSDPVNPVYVNHLAGFGTPNYLNAASDVFVAGDYAYVTTDVDDSLVIFDIRNPEVPVLQGYIAGEGFPNYLNQSRSVFVSGNYAYVGSIQDNSFTVIDISNLYWRSTQADYSYAGDADLFTVSEHYGHQELQTNTTDDNTHIHFAYPEAANWTDYIFTGQMRENGSDQSAYLGVTFFSRYPFDVDLVDSFAHDNYYSLIRDEANPNFHIETRGGHVCVGTTDSGLDPESNTDWNDDWINFEIQVEDDDVNNTRIQASVWVEGHQGEPGTWQIDCTVSGPARLTSGTIGVWTYDPNNLAQNREWDNLEIADINPSSCVGGVCQCGDTVSGNVTLTQNINNCFGNGLIMANNAVLDCDGHTITGIGGTSSSGIVMDDISNAAVQNCNVTNFGMGIDVDESNNSTLSGNNVFGNYEGSNLFKSNNITMQGNDYYSNTYYNLKISGDSTPYDPAIYNSHTIYDREESNASLRNNVNHQDILYLVGQDGLTFDGDDGNVAHITMVDTNNATLRDFNLNNGDSINLINTSDVRVDNNTISNTGDYGIQLSWAEKTRIINNAINSINIGGGIKLHESDYNMIEDNDISNVEHDGILLQGYGWAAPGSAGNIITNNNIYGGDLGELCNVNNSHNGIYLNENHQVATDPNYIVGEQPGLASGWDLPGGWTGLNPQNGYAPNYIRNFGNYGIHFMYSFNGVIVNNFIENVNNSGIISSYAWDDTHVYEIIRNTIQGFPAGSVECPGGSSNYTSTGITMGKRARISENTINSVLDECIFSGLIVNAGTIISDNELDCGGDGIHMEDAIEVTILNNRINSGYGAGDDMGDGIELIDVDGSEIKDNVIVYQSPLGPHANGIYMQGSDDNIFDNNDISQYSYSGIRIQGSNYGNTFLRNKIYHNRYNGLYLRELPNGYTESPDNRNIFYANEIYNNGVDNLLASNYGSGYNQVFDYPSNLINGVPLLYFYANKLRYYDELTDTVTESAPYNLIDSSFEPITHLSIADSNNLLVQGITIDAKINPDIGKRYTNDSIHIINGEDVILDSVTVKNNYTDTEAITPPTGISFFIGSGFNIRDTKGPIGVTLNKCSAIDNGNHALIISSSRDVLVKDCLFEGNGQGSWERETVEINGNVYSDTDKYGGNIKIENTQIINNFGRGINFYNSFGGDDLGYEEWIEITGDVPTDPYDDEQYKCKITGNYGGISGSCCMGFIKIQNCLIDSNNNGYSSGLKLGISLINGQYSGWSIDDISILNNKISNHQNTAINLRTCYYNEPDCNNTSQRSTNYLIDGNIIEDNGPSISMECDGGDNDGNPCTMDSECPGTGGFCTGVLSEAPIPAVYLRQVDYSEISNNHVLNNQGIGIHLRNSDSNIFDTNNIENNFNYQIYNESSADNYYTNNTLNSWSNVDGEDWKRQARFLYFWGNYQNQILQNNTAGGKQIYYYYQNRLEGMTQNPFRDFTHAPTNTLINPDTLHITVGNSSNFNVIDYGTESIPIAYSDPVKYAWTGGGGSVQNSHMLNCRGGHGSNWRGQGRCIVLSQSSPNDVFNNTLSATGYNESNDGIYLYGSTNSQIYNNKMPSDIDPNYVMKVGISISSSNYNTIGLEGQPNIFENNRYGIYSNYSRGNDIGYNTFTNNCWNSGRGINFNVQNGAYTTQFPNQSLIDTDSNKIHDNIFNNSECPERPEVSLGAHYIGTYLSNRYNDFYKNDFQISGVLDEGEHNNYCNGWEIANFNKFSQTGHCRETAASCDVDGDCGGDGPCDQPNIPTDASNCDVPEVDLYTIPVQRLTDRDYSLAERENNRGLVDVWSKFADYEGNVLEGLLHYGLAPGQDPVLGTKSVLLAGDTSATIGGDPNIDNVEDYPLGVFTSQAIETTAWSSDTPTELEKNDVRFVWNSKNNLSDVYGMFRVSVSDRDIKLNDAWGRLRTDGSNIASFDLDLLAPQISNFEVTGSTGSSITLSWDVPGPAEPNWNTARAHYEIWYGPVENEVIAYNRDTYPQVFKWDERLADPNGDPQLANQSRNTTEIKNITNNPAYFYLCAVDDYGNEQCLLNVPLPWIETKHGSIYAQGNISGLPGSPIPGEYNATYLIAANGSITNFRSECNETGSCIEASAQWLNDGFGNILFPQQQFIDGAELYFAKASGEKEIGYIDIDGIIKGLYGQTVDASTLTSGPLGGKVYYSDVPSGDLTIGSALQFDYDGGAGTVIVEGNLNINANIAYGAGWPTNLGEMTSIAWIVLGDVIIDETVTNIAGNFIVLGNGTACPAVGCGWIHTGAVGGGTADQSLDVYGIMMGRRFNFERITNTPSRGSETITFDGRILANTPPGLSDITKALPEWE